jgi:hypothetical protein
MSGGSIGSFVRRTSSFLFVALVCFPALALAQSPWERAASNLERTFTGLPHGRSPPSPS